MRIDPYKNKEKYLRWKNSGATIENVSKKNQDLIRKFLFDMEDGTNINISNKKGARSYIRLNAYRSKLKFFAQQFEDKYNISIDKVSKQHLNKISKDMREGTIVKQDGKKYTDPADYIKSFKAFWHWYMKVSPKEIEDITLEVDVSKDKPKWVYLDDKQFKTLTDNCTYYYRVIALFLYFMSLRVGEMKNIRVFDFEDDFTSLNVRDEISKTYGRKIKTLMCRELIKEYVTRENLKNDDLLFQKNVTVMNRYFKRIGKRLFGEGISKAKNPYSSLTLADFRHMSACYWLPRYPTQQGMMYRFGWKKSDKIFYYSEFLNMADNIGQDDLLIDITKTDLQKEIERLKNESELNKEKNKELMVKIQKMYEEQVKVSEMVVNKLNKLEARQIQTKIK